MAAPERTTRRRPRSKKAVAPPEPERALGGSDFAADGMIAPETLMTSFAKSRVGVGIVFAAVVHLLVIGAFSTKYIMTEYLGMAVESPLEEREKAAVQEAHAEMQAIAAKYGLTAQELRDKVAPPSVRPPETVKAPAREEEPTATSTDSAPSDVRPDRPASEIEKKITETASPDEIPDQPDEVDDLLEGL